MSALALLAAAALANPQPSTVVEGDWVVMRMAMEVPMSVVHKAIDSAAEVMAFGGEREILSLKPDGDCEVVEIQTPGPIGPMTYTVRRCATVDGFAERMIASDDFHANETEWHLAETATGTEIVYRVLVDPDIPTPSFLVNNKVKSAMAETLKDLYAVLTE